ncbi:DarT ssDNA thymidine ADP-ribosyltransferase family protein [Devosia sp.]|uniref:DarT ssDNA thymidine ADP-ribosyltransferase family protein n=1 Tax=Devosia sp. TaxID=1871048 RepID=UPI003F6FD716
MSLTDAYARRNIGEVVHFTTNHGCLGTLYTRLLQSRQRLQSDEMVRFLFSPNANLRKDTKYIDHVSLSIGHINTSFFRTSADSWHRQEPIFWCVMSFSPEIMAHEGVEFATTNNIYTGVSRGMGEAGFDALFRDRIVRWTGNNVSRSATAPSYYPTCPQAEVLYPAAVSTDHLQRIYVRTADEQSEVVGFLKATFHRDVDVVVCPDKFGDRPSQ